MKFDTLIDFNNKVNSPKRVINESFKGLAEDPLRAVLQRFINSNRDRITTIAAQYNLELASLEPDNRRERPLYEIVLTGNLKTGKMKTLNGLLAIKLASDNTQSLIAYVSSTLTNRFAEPRDVTVWSPNLVKSRRDNVSEVLTPPALYIINNDNLQRIENYTDWSNSQNRLKVSDLKPSRGIMKRPLGDQLAEHFGKEFASTIKKGKADRTDMSGYKALTTSSNTQSANIYFTLCTQYYRDSGDIISAVITQLRLLEKGAEMKRVCGKVSSTPGLVLNDNMNAVSITTAANIRLVDILQSGDDIVNEYDSLVSNAINPKFILKKLKQIQPMISDSAFSRLFSGYKFVITEGYFDEFKDFFKKSVLDTYRNDSLGFRADLVTITPERLTSRPTTKSHTFYLYFLKDRKTGKDFVAYRDDSNVDGTVLILTRNNINNTLIGEIKYSPDQDEYNNKIIDMYNKLTPMGREIFMRSIARSI